ncbi:hypothetical protein Tco_0538501 [Tanacetum coccineum]
MAARTKSCRLANTQVDFTLNAVVSSPPTIDSSCTMAANTTLVVLHRQVGERRWKNREKHVMILGTDQHCFDVHNNSYFLHLPLKYVNGVILYMSVARMPYEPFGEFLEEKSGNFFKGHKAIPKRDKGKKKDNETEGVKARTSTVDSKYDSDFDSDDDHDYDSDSVVDYLSPGEEELIELRNKIKANRENNAKECLTYYALANGFSLWYGRSYGKKVVAKCGTRPPKLSDPAKARMKEIKIKEYLAMEIEWMAKQKMNSSSKKLWHLAEEDEKEESYIFDMNEFPTIQLGGNLSSNSESHIVVPVCSIGTIEEKLKIDAKKFNLLKINDNLFTYNTPLGVVFDEFKRLSSMEDDLFTYELGVVEDFYFPYVEQSYDEGDLNIYEARVCHDECEKIYAESAILINRRLVRLIDITVEKWLDLKFDDHKMVGNKKAVGALKFSNYKTMDWYMKNALWIYWVRGDDEKVLTEDEFSDLGKENINEENEISEIFRI